MADVTDVLALPFPEGADANDVPADMQALAERLDEVPGVESLTAVEIAALGSALKPEGRPVYNSTTGKLQVSNGTDFVDVDAAALASAALKLPLAGGTVTGKITLDGNPSSALHAAPKQYVDTMLPKSGGTMTGDIDADGNKVTGLAAASTNGDAVRYEQAVMKAGDTMSGTLIVDRASGYSSVILKNADAAFWISTDPGASNALTIAVLNKTTLAYVATAMSVNPTTGEVTFPNGIRVPIAGIDYY